MTFFGFLFSNSKIPDQNLKIQTLSVHNSLIFLVCHLKCNDKVIASASGVWKILKIKASDLGSGD